MNVTSTAPTTNYRDVTNERTRVVLKRIHHRTLPLPYRIAYEVDLLTGVLCTTTYAAKWAGNNFIKPALDRNRPCPSQILRLSSELKGGRSVLITSLQHGSQQ